MERIDETHTILIDLPDYSRTNSGQMNRDLTSIDEWWENTLCFDSPFREYEQYVNLVVFFQKELFKGHFSLGKYDVIELDPLTPEQLTDYYKEQFGTDNSNPYWPFQGRKPLWEVAALSRGIFRRFKKYLCICLEKLYDRRGPIVLNEDWGNCNTITLSNAKQWITNHQLIKDMELELMTIFPKSKRKRNETVKLLQ